MLSVRRTALLSVILDLCVLVSLALTYGRRHEFSFLKNEFENFSFEYCLSRCVSDVAMVALAKDIIFFLLYVFAGLQAWWPFLVITLVVTVGGVTEAAWIILELDEYNIWKLIFLGFLVVAAWAEFVLLYLASAAAKRRARDNYNSSDEERSLLKSNKKGSLSGLFHSSKGKKKHDPFAEKREILIPDDSPLVASMSRSSLFRQSLVEDAFQSRYGIHHGQFHVPIQPEQDFQYEQAASTSTAVLPSLPRLIALMMDPEKGVEVDNRKHLFKVHSECFVGSAAVTWLRERLRENVSTREQAREIGQQLMDNGYFDHVSGDMRFLDETSAFYRFAPNVDGKLIVAPLTPTNSQRHFAMMEEVMRESADGRPITSDDILRSLAEMESLSYDSEDRSDSVHSSDDETMLKQQEKAKKKESEATQLAVDEVEIPIEGDSPQEEYPIHKPQQQEVEEEEEEYKPPKNRKLSPLMKNFVKEMKHPTTGIPIEEHKHYISNTEFNIFQRCFKGSQVVDFLVARLHLDQREHAFIIAQKMLAAGVFQHVLNTKKFKDENLYRFQEDS